MQSITSEQLEVRVRERVSITIDDSQTTPDHQEEAEERVSE